jgi:hypothetical protein
MLADHVTGVYQVRGWWQQMCTLICLFRLYIYNVHKIYKPPSSSTFSKCSDENQVINFMWPNLICNCMNWFDCLDPPSTRTILLPLVVRGSTEGSMCIYSVWDDIRIPCTYFKYTNKNLLIPNQTDENISNSSHVINGSFFLIIRHGLAP